tara:strand:+ start:315 stop:527 length:213 start_codon:yes stop_codon:yes gene_type:complete
MKIWQDKDGTGHIGFNDQEIHTLNKTKEIVMPPETLKHFGNHIVRIVAEWNANFNDDIKILQSNGEEFKK